jgi:DNA-directed RNA polymerase specialized sigma24 family protein
LRYQTQKRRGGGGVRGESALINQHGSLAEAGGGWDQFLSREPTPEEVARFGDEWDRLFARLEDPVLALIARRKLDGYTSEDIAAELDVSLRTVDRKVRLIRTLWEADADSRDHRH